jgi:hypothetical protein
MNVQESDFVSCILYRADSKPEEWFPKLDSLHLRLMYNMALLLMIKLKFRIKSFASLPVNTDQQA